METDIERSNRIYNEKINSEATHYRDTDVSGRTFKYPLFYRIKDGRPQYLDLWNNWSNHTYDKRKEEEILKLLKPWT